MSPLLLTLALGASIARADVPEGTYAVDCVDSEVSLTFSIRHASEPDHSIFEDRAVIDTACGPGVGAERAELFRMVMRDVCQAVGEPYAACADVLKKTLEPIDQVADAPLKTLSVASFGGAGERLAEVAVGLAGDTRHALPT